VTRQPPRTAVPRMPHPPEQLRQGLCARPGADPGLWASTQPTRRAYAITLCRACPVRAPCASYALAAPPDRLPGPG
jgi:Transcription factor WhiB